MTRYDILNFLESEGLYSFLWPWKVLFIVITIAFIFAIFYYIRKAGYLPKEMNRRIGDFLSFQKNKSEQIFVNKYKSISGFFLKKDYKRAILMMEELFISVFNHLEVKGDDLLEMVNNSSISEMEEIRNLYIIAEEIKSGRGYILNLEELEKLFKSCEEALKKLKIIS